MKIATLAAFAASLVMLAATGVEARTMHHHRSHHMMMRGHHMHMMGHARGRMPASRNF